MRGAVDPAGPDRAGASRLDDVEPSAHAARRRGGAGGAIPIPPWCVPRLAEALCDEQAENVVGSFRALGASAALNAAVAAAAGPVPGDEADDVAIPREKKTKNAETSQEGGGAFTPRERERIRSSSRLGARGVERVERADGVWYVNPESASRNAR